MHLDLPRKYKNKQVLDLKIIIYYVYQIQWVIRVGKKYLPQPCQTVRSCKIMYTQKTHECHSCKSKVANNNREFVVDSVIQANGTVEFEDGMRTGVLLGGCWGP